MAHRSTPLRVGWRFRPLPPTSTVASGHPAPQFIEKVQQERDAERTQLCACGLLRQEDSETLTIGGQRPIRNTPEIDLSIGPETGFARHEGITLHRVLHCHYVIIEILIEEFPAVARPDRI